MKQIMNQKILISKLKALNFNILKDKVLFGLGFLPQVCSLPISGLSSFICIILMKITGKFQDHLHLTIPIQKIPMIQYNGIKLGPTQEEE